ncbi:MAG: 50S ribosomal protein L18 [Candidatus Latescibacterota bacterium]|jgi:large subunit ribosomal protein L18
MKKKFHNPKEHKRNRRHMHIRNKVAGTADRPRVCVFRSNTHIYVQIIDDDNGHTLAAASSLKVELPKAEAAPPAAEENGEGKKKKKKGGKKARAAEGIKILQAKEVGRAVAEAAKTKGITKVRFDRGGFLYHGRVAALAQSMRENGLEF